MTSLVETHARMERLLALLPERTPSEGTMRQYRGVHERMRRAGCYDPQAIPNQALAWHHDFAVSRERLRDCVTTSGTRLDRDRPTRVTPWPGGESENGVEPDASERPVTERTKDFVDFVAEQVAARTAEQDAVIRQVIDAEQERH